MKHIVQHLVLVLQIISSGKQVRFTNEHEWCAIIDGVWIGIFDTLYYTEIVGTLLLDYICRLI